MLAADLGSKTGQPCGQPGQVGVGGSKMLAFLPVESLVHEQGQPGGDQKLDRGHHSPQQQESTVRALYVLHSFILHMPLNFLEKNPGKRCSPSHLQGKC